MLLGKPTITKMDEILEDEKSMLNGHFSLKFW